jgi:hypothetical protein
VRGWEIVDASGGFAPEALADPAAEAASGEGPARTVALLLRAKRA